MSGETQSWTLGCAASSREGSKAPPSPPLPQNNCPPSLGSSRRRRPSPARRPGGHGAGGEAEGREGRVLLAEQSPRHALLTPRADKRSLRGCRSHAPPARARWAKCSHRGERPGWGGRPPRSRDLAHPSPRAPAPGTPRSHQVPPLPVASPNTPSPTPQPPATPNNGLSHAARRGLGDPAKQAAPEPGAQQPPPARPPASHRPPTRSPAVTWKIGLTFLEPARPRAPLSLCLWQTWFAEKRAPSLAAAAATTPAAPELPLAPGPLPGARPLARSRSPRRAPLPPPQALAPRSFQLSKRQPRPWPHRPGTPPAPARPGVPVPPLLPLARRPGYPLALSRARPPSSACAALCASGTAAAAAAAGLLGAQPNVATPARERSGRQRPAIDSRPGQSAQGGGSGGRSGRDALSAPGRGSGCSGRVIHSFKGGGRLRATPWPPRLYRVANFQSPGLRKADLHLLKQGRKQEMSTVCLPFPASII